MRRVLAVAFAAAAMSGCADRGAEEGKPAEAGEGADAAAWFEDVTTASGVRFRHQSGREEKPFFPEIMGGGVALLDMDGDGDLDVYLIQSGSVRHPGTDAARNRLYRNRGDGTFDDVTDGSGADDRGYGMGVTAGDYDNDGDPDLYVTNRGPNALLRNDGDGRFSDVTEESGAGDPAWGTSVTFSDLDSDGDLDLFIANYVNWSPETEIECLNPAGVPDYCLPLSYEAPSRDTLLRNNGDGTFTDVSEAAGLADNVGYGLGVACADFDGDGATDVFIANDSVFNHLWMNRGGLAFEDEALIRGCAVDEDGVAKAGMGVMAVDYDDDGDHDLFVCNLERQSDSYYRNEDGFFFDRTPTVGLGHISRGFTRFGVGFQDFDQDGRRDLYIADGRVTLPPGEVPGDPYAEENLLFRGLPDGTMEEVVPRGGTRVPHRYTSRGVAFGDLNGDGAVDAVVANRDGPAQILRNVVRDRGHWIALQVLEETGGAALGATVRLRAGERAVTRTVQSGYSYQASSDSRVHFGLGDAGTAGDVTVRWVDGVTERFGDLEAGRVHVIRRGEGQSG
jgi:hypothetical protein